MTAMVVKVWDEGPVRVVAIDRPDKGNAINRAVAIALEPYFFCVCLIASIGRGFVLFAFFFCYFNYLPVDNIGASSHSQNNKDGEEDAFQSQPFI